MYKMIAIDLDDTLLNDSHEIGHEDKKALLDAKEAGVKLCMVTGRNYYSAKPFLEQVSFVDLMGCLNGAYIVDPPSEQFLYQFPIRGDVCAEILKDIEKIGIYVNAYHDHRVMCSEKTDLTDYYKELTGVQAEVVGKLSRYVLNMNIGKLLLIDETERLKQIKKVLESQYSQTVYFTFSKPTHLEVNSIHASKGVAVKTIARHFGFTREDIIAIGNDENDVSMLEYAGLGIAMGNASDKVKKHVNAITVTNNENGIARVIHQYLGF